MGLTVLRIALVCLNKSRLHVTLLMELATVSLDTKDHRVKEVCMYRFNLQASQIHRVITVLLYRLYIARHNTFNYS